MTRLCYLGKYWICFFMMLLLLSQIASAQVLTNESSQILIASSVSAQDTLAAVKHEYELTQERNDINTDELLRLKKEKTDFINQPISTRVDSALLNRADLEVAIANSNLEGAGLAQAEAQQVADTVSVRINNLANQLQAITLAAGKTEAAKIKIAAMQSELNTQKAILKWQNKLVQALSTSLDIATQRHTILVSWRAQLYNIYQVQQKQFNDQKLFALEQKIQQKQALWLKQLAELNKKLALINPKEANYENLRSALELEILAAQEQSNLLRMQLVLMKVKSEINQLYEPLPLDLDVQILKNKINDAETISNELSNIKNIINQKINVLKKRISLETKAKTTMNSDVYYLNVTIIQKLLTAYQQNLLTLDKLQTKVSKQQVFTQAALNKALARRQGLPGFNLIAWQELAQQIMTMPGLMAKAGLALKDQIFIAASKLTVFALVSLILIELAWLWACMYARKSLSHLLNTCKTSEKQLKDKGRLVTLLLCQRNLLSIYVIMGLVIAIWFMGLSLTSFSTLFYLLIVWLIFKFALGVAKMMLVENVNVVDGGDVLLYRELSWSLIIGGILTALMVLAQQLPVGYEVTDFFNRLFMVFLLVTAIVLLRNWRVVPMLLQPFTHDKRAYLFKVIRFLALFIPLVVLSTAVIGLLGYVDFAWTLSKHEGILILVMSGYIIARGILKDIFQWLSEVLISYLNHGWLLRQALLKPLEKILRLILIALAIFAVFWFYGWDQHSIAYQKLTALLNMFLINTKGLSLRVKDLIALIIAGFVVRWVTVWSREFAFRWMYQKQRDIGVRNSLATLTQYLVFLASIFLALKIVGVDLSGISYVLAGFAAGVGLGLRDIIKNYASGLLLLFERPVKTGDTVTIGDFEGEVTHMGMRAMTIKTSDHMQVLVPNSETFEKPFTNWTHVDTIIRTVIKLKVVREDDPNNVKDIILSVLRQNNAVLTEPSPQVYLMNMDDALLEFEIRYFINLQQGKSRTQIRSEVLFVLFEAFKAQDIHTPYQQQDIYVKNLPTNV